MKALKNYLARRNAIANLYRLTDRQLEDIGIPRKDIKRIVTTGR